MNHLSIDLETFSSRHNAAIVSIGACFFDPANSTIGETFYANVDANSCKEQGFDIELTNLYWWCQQPAEAGAALYDDRKAIDVALLMFNQFINNHKVGKRLDTMWSHVTFDHVVLMNAYRQVGITPVFGYRESRDIRTLNYLVGDVEVKREGIHHNALDDAIYQAKYISAMLQKF